MTQYGAEQPLAVGDVIDDVKWHDKNGHECIGERQRHDEYVLHALQRPIGEHRQDHENVAEHTRQTNDQIDRAFRELDN